jgi:hypothetical protein
MADTNLFSRLQRLFSTDVVLRNAGGNQLKLIDINQIQRTGDLQTNALVDRFSRIYTNPNSTSLGAQQSSLNYATIRTQIYSEYDTMDTDAIVASALDILADECTLKNDMGEVLAIKSSDENVQKILYNLFYDVLNIEFSLGLWVRNMCKYGDFFLKLEIAEKFGIYNALPYNAFNIERLENTDPDNPFAIKFRLNPEGTPSGGHGYYNKSKSNEITFDNYEVAHFRLLTDTNYLPYGRSYIEPARKVFKQYTLMEDAMLIHRIVRAPEKRIFYINVGNIPPAEVENFMQKTISKMKRTPHIDPQTGEYNLKFNMQNMLEDFYIPVRGNDTATKIDTAAGLAYDGITDVNYYRDKIFAALKIPKAFMGYDENTNGKATLAAQDIRFARTIERIQRIMVSELTKIALIHLYSQGYKDETLTNFELSLTTPSIIYDQERIALMKEKMDLAAQMLETKLFPSDFIYDHIFHLSEDLYDEYRDLIREDAARDFRLAQIAEEGNDPKKTGRSYGTPHDLASLYGTGRMESDPSNVPSGYNENSKLGRPKESVSNINKQGNAFGRDRLGKAGMKKDHDDTKNTFKTAYKGGSPLALEMKTMLSKVPKNKKQLVFENENIILQNNLLDESQLKLDLD